MSRADRVKRETGKVQVTKVVEKVNTTTKQQLPIRMTIQERNELDLLVEAVKDHLSPAKAEKLNRSRVLRAMVYIKDERFLKKIAQSILDNT
jgi:hypothetical protein